MTTIAPLPTIALEADLYVDPAVAAREQQAIFERSWQLAGHVADVAEAGSYLTARAGAESVLVIRGEDGELRAFRNVCRHRATRLREGRGTCGKALRCPYHGWTYRTDGRLIGVPEGRGFPGLKKADLPLLPARVEVFSGLRLRQSRRRRRAAARLARRARGAARALRPRAARALHGVDEPPAGELEDRRRQLSRGLPRPDRPSWTHAAARLSALHGRGGGGLRVLRGRRCATSRRATGSSAPTSAWCGRCRA